MAAHVMSVVPDRSAVGTILKQAGLSESVFFQNGRKFVMKTYVEWVSIDDESD